LCHPESLVYFSLHGRSSEVMVGLLLPRASARVTQRTARFIEALEQAPRKPDAWKCEHVQRTQAALNELDFPCGRRAAVAGRRGPISPTTAIAVYVKCTIVDNHRDK
jgi:hypothetical protein